MIENVDRKNSFQKKLEKLFFIRTVECKKIIKKTEFRRYFTFLNSGKNRRDSLKESYPKGF